MNRALRAAAWSLLFVSPALASEGGQLSLGFILAHAFNLGLLIYLIVHFAKRPIQRALVARADGVAKEIKAASALHAEAEAVLDEYQRKLSGLDAEIAELKARYADEAEAERARIIEQAEAEAERIVRDAERQADSETRRAQAALEGEIVDRAIAAAEQAIREKLTPADHRRLTADYLAKLEEAGQI